MISMIAAVAVVIGIGLWISGSPATLRQERIDLRRVKDLRELSEAVDCFWKKEDHLPEKLADLTDWEGLETPRADPETKEPYSYSKTAEKSYRLCAVFSLPSSDPLPRHRFRAGPSVWHHPSGESCFDLEPEEDED